MSLYHYFFALVNAVAAGLNANGGNYGWAVFSGLLAVLLSLDGCANAFLKGRKP